MFGSNNSKSRVPGMALIIVFLIISIFFIIAVTISTIVMLEARSTLEKSLSGMSFYLADAGIRFATPKVMFRFFIEKGLTSTQEVYETYINLGDPEYKGKLIIEFYDIEKVLPPEDGFTHKERIACNGQILRASDSVLIAQRDIFAEIYLMNDTGEVNATVKNYYEKNR